MTNFNLIITITVLIFSTIESTILNAQRNYYKNKLERNNKVNKKVWVRNSNVDKGSEKRDGVFLFRPDSVEENVFDNNFNLFDDQHLDEGTIVTSYIQRTKRSSKKKHRSKRLGQNFEKVECKENCQTNINPVTDNAVTTHSKILSKLRPASFFTDYPYEVAVYIKRNFTTDNKNKSYVNEVVNVDATTEVSFKNKSLEAEADVTQTAENKTSSTKEMNDKLDSLMKTDNNTLNYTESGTNFKRSMKEPTSENDIVKKIAFTEILNKTEDILDASKMNRNIFDQDFPVWQQNAPLPDMNTENKYIHENHLVVLPKVVTASPVNKQVTEGGLVKVISMLTKTFKKIMKHHHNINRMHEEITGISDEFKKVYEVMCKKLDEFNNKYNILLAYNKNLVDIDTKLRKKEEINLKKEKDFSSNLIEFESQQKKFLAQQSQFYNMQRVMLTENEKINVKQNLIAKTLKDIASKQSTFSQNLKKIKLTQTDNKPFKNVVKQTTHKPSFATTMKKLVTTTPFFSDSTTPSMKINLLPIPIVKRIENHDQGILNEKDIQPVDDIVYKYYFNNTFLENLIKNRILNGFSMFESFGSKRNVKNKRFDVLKPEMTTILLPVNNSMNNDGVAKAGETVIRERRWINHQFNRRHRKKNRPHNNDNLVENSYDNNKGYIKQYRDFRTERSTIPVEFAKNEIVNVKSVLEKEMQEPFVKMAKTFCMEIGQDMNGQELNWCIEKAIRRLKVMDTRSYRSNNNVKLQYSTNNNKPVIKNVLQTQSTASANQNIISSSTTDPQIFVQSVTTKEQPPPSTKAETVYPTPIFMYFPDNDELETNLKQYELKPDLEGNVYFDGSLHESDLRNDDSMGVSDFMPSVDSNSQVDTDPIALELQDQRRSYVRQMNENILKAISERRH